MVHNFSKEIFTFYALPYQSVVGLTAYFLGREGVHDATLLPEVIKSRIHISMPGFK